MLIKPLSVNEVWRGRRYKTQAYLAYEEELMYLLPPLSVPTGKLELVMEVGVSNKRSDLDNFAKPFIDILQKKYGFNDNKIYKITMIKEDVEKKLEYIRFKFNSYREP